MVRPYDAVAPAITPFRAVRGSPFRLLVDVLDADGVAVDLTGATLVAVLRAAQAPAATVLATLTVVDLGGGVLEATLTSATVTALSVIDPPAWLEVKATGSFTGGQPTVLRAGWFLLE